MLTRDSLTESSRGCLSGILAKRNCSPTFNERRPNPHKNCESTSEASQRRRLSELKAFHFIEMMDNKENQKKLDM